MEIRRHRFINTDGSENEYVRVSTCNFYTPEQVELLSYDLQRAAREWRAEIATRGPPGPPSFKTFDLISSAGGRNRIASWVEHPWALARHGTGTSPVFLVKEEGQCFKAWLLSVKLENREHRWKCRLESASKIEKSDLIYTFPRSLPYSPTVGDIEFARNCARRGA
jgi:hypothetical protein